MKKITVLTAFLLIIYFSACQKEETKNPPYNPYKKSLAYYDPYKSAPMDPRVCSLCHGVTCNDTSIHCGAGNFTYDFTGRDPRKCSICHRSAITDTSVHCGAGNFTYDTVN